MRLRVIKSYITRDLKIVFTDKAALFWLIAWPLIWVFMVAYVFVPPGSVTPIKLDIGIINYDQVTNSTRLNFTSSDFIKILEKIEYNGSKMFNVIIYDDEQQLRNDLRKGRIDLGLIIPKNFSLNVTYGIARLKVLVGARDPYSGSINYASISLFIAETSRRVGMIRANITLNYVLYYMRMSGGYNETQFKYIRDYYIGIASPINATYEEVKPSAFMKRENILGWYIVGAVGMMFLYSGFSYGASVLINEKERGSLKRLLASPLTEAELIVSTIVSNIVILSLAGTIAIILGVLGTGAKILFNIYNPFHWLVPILIIDGAFMSTGLGIMLSPLAKTSQGASGLGIALGLMLSFTAGIWFPRSMMPSWMNILANYFPVTWVFDAIRYIMLFNRGFTEVYPLLLKIAMASIVIVVLDIMIYKYNLRKYVEKY